MKTNLAAVRQDAPLPSAARERLADHLSALVVAQKSLQACQEPLQRLRHWETEASEAAAGVASFDDAYRQALESWAATGVGDAPQMDGKRREALATRAATSAVKRDAARAAAADFEAAQASANARLRELNAALPACVADVLVEEAQAVIEHHNALLRQAAQDRAVIEAISAMLTGTSMNADGNHHGLRAAERLRSAIIIDSQFTSMQRDAARNRVQVFANDLAGNPNVTF